MQLRTGELPLMQQLVRQLAGVVLDDHKGYLIESRLGPIAEQQGCANFNELYFKLRYGSDQKLTQAVVDAITTHETNWFRDGTPFEALQFKVIPEVIDARARMGQAKRLRIWSAASSSGQEAYSVGMILCELIPDIASWDVQILGTDISRSSVESAQRAVYAEHEMQRTSRPQLMSKYFEPVPGGFRVKEQVRKLCRFEVRNLMEPVSGLGPFDVVFVRNVLIYFDGTAKQELMRRIRNCVLPHGWLFVGSTENLMDCGAEWIPQTHCRATVYQPNTKPMPVSR
jgi:chemotaxis protein methyltransferase CheR